MDNPKPVVPPTSWDAGKPVSPINPAAPYSAPAAITAPKERKPYKLIRGQHARREPVGDPNGAFVHYRAGSPVDTIMLTEAEANHLGRTYLAEVGAGGIVKPTQAQTAYIAEQAKIGDAVKAEEASKA